MDAPDEAEVSLGLGGSMSALVSAEPLNVNRVLPWPELTTSTNEVTLGKHRLTGDGYLHHANDGGHKDAAKGFEMKVLALRVWLERANQTGRCRCELRSAG